MRVQISRRFANWALGLLLGVVAVMVLVSFTTQASAYIGNEGFPLTLLSALDSAEAGIPWLSIDQEQSIPAWFSSSLLLLCAALLWSLSTTERSRFTIHWRILAVLFLLLSADEAVGFHERTIVPLRATFGASELLYFAWVVPGAVLVTVVGVAYIRFLLALPVRTRFLVMLAGILFVVGALAMEMLGGRHVETFGQANVEYVALSTIEEFFEMTGLIIFLYALMSYRASKAKDPEQESAGGAHP